LAVRIYVIPAGRTITLHTEDGNLCEVLTTLSTGLNALNGLTSQVQYFATGTSGTDFGISSATDTHTFNLPTASSINRGALSSSDWSTFSGKVGGSGATGQVAYWNGTSAQSGSNNLFWDNKGDVIKSYLINDIGMKYLNEFFEGLHNPENEEYQIPTQILPKADLLKTEGYYAVFGVNLQHRYGFSPQIVDGKKFLNSIELLIALNSDTTETKSLSSLISDLETRAATDINIQYSLDTLNNLYMEPISSIIKYYESFIKYFKQ
jgi:hypothetical protein